VTWNDLSKANERYFRPTYFGLACACSCENRRFCGDSVYTKATLDALHCGWLFASQLLQPLRARKQPIELLDVRRCTSLGQDALNEYRFFRWDIGDEPKTF